MNYLRKLKTAILSPLRGGRGFDIRNIRPGMLVYLLAYVLELVFYCVRGHYIYVETRLFGLSGSTLGYAFHVVGSLVIMLLWKPRFRKLIYISVFLFAAVIFLRADPDHCPTGRTGAASKTSLRTGCFPSS